MRYFLVVGDPFLGYAQRTGGITLTEARTVLLDNPVADRVLLRAGLGVVEEEWRLLAKLAESKPEVSLSGGPPRSVHHALLDKRHQRNVFLGEPEIGPDGRFIARLVVASDADLVRDVPPRWIHVSAAVLSEAVTQLVLWAIRHQGGRYLVLRSLRSTYHRFAFPTETVMTASFVAEEYATVDIEQGGCLVAQFDLDFKVSDASILDVERHQAVRG